MIAPLSRARLLLGVNECAWCGEFTGAPYRHYREVYCGEAHARLGRWKDRGLPMVRRVLNLAHRVRTRQRGSAFEHVAEADLACTVAQGLGDCVALMILGPDGTQVAHEAAVLETWLLRLCGPLWAAEAWAEAEEYIRSHAERAGCTDLQPEPLDSKRLTTPAGAEEST